MALRIPEEVRKKFPALKEYAKKIGISVEKIKDEDLFLCTFVHKSYASDFKEEYSHNERLEFVWDSILGSIIAKKLFITFPEMTEAHMTLYKIALVREETLSIVAKKIGLNKEIFISKWEEKNDGRNKASITSDALESLIGYIALDIWYPEAEEFVLNYIYSEIDELSISVKSYKTRAQEYIQKMYKKIPIYVDSEEKTDNKHNVLVFRSEIRVNNECIAVWYGTNKKKAQEDAAKNYCESLTSAWKSDWKE